MSDNNGRHSSSEGITWVATSGEIFWGGSWMCRVIQGSSKNEEVKTDGGVERGGKVGREFKRTRAFDAGGEQRQLPWKPHPCLSHRVTREGGKKKRKTLDKSRLTGIERQIGDKKKKKNPGVPDPSPDASPLHPITAPGPSAELCSEALVSPPS